MGRRGLDPLAGHTVLFHAEAGSAVLSALYRAEAGSAVLSALYRADAGYTVLSALFLPVPPPTQVSFVRA